MEGNKSIDKSTNFGKDLNTKDKMGAKNLFNMKKKDETNLMQKIRQIHEKECEREYNILKKYIEKNEINKMLHLVEEACEGPNAIKDPKFYRMALDKMLKLPNDRYYLHIESIAQSAAIACIRDESVYRDAIDKILTPYPSISQGRDWLGEIAILKHEWIESACRILASISITNEKTGCATIDAPSAFKLAIERIENSVIANEKRAEEKPNRMVEVLEHAFSAKQNPEVTRELYERVYTYIKTNPDLSNEYKIKTLAEITTKAIKAPGVSHTKLFTETIAFLKQNKATNLARSILVLLDVYKK